MIQSTDFIGPLLTRLQNRIFVRQLVRDLGVLVAIELFVFFTFILALLIYNLDVLKSVFVQSVIEGYTGSGVRESTLSMMILELNLASILKNLTPISILFGQYSNITGGEFRILSYALRFGIFWLILYMSILLVVIRKMKSCIKDNILFSSESSIFPIPPDIILIPMIIAKRINAFFYAFVCTISSVIGGVIGYCIGFFFFNSLGILIINYYGLQNQFNNFEQYYQLFGIWLVLGAGFTPFPFKFITIASGFFGFNIFIFILASLIARGLRFYILAFLLKIYGQTIEKLIDKYFNLLAILFFILLIGFILIIKFL